jgi:hypothetical protein
VNDEPARGGAPLARGTDGAENDVLEGQIEVGALGDDDAVVAAEFEETPTEACRDDLPDVPTHAAGTRGRDQREPAIGDQFLADDLIAPDDQGKEAGMAQIGGDAIGDTAGGNRRKRREKAGLPDRDIAADGREHGVPSPDRMRKIECRDHADWAQWLPLLHQAVLRTLAGHREAVKLAREPDGKIRDVDRFLDFADPLRTDLADLERDQFAKRFAVAAEFIANRPHHLASRRRGNIAPGAKRPDGFGNRLFA